MAKRNQMIAKTGCRYFVDAPADLFSMSIAIAIAIATATGIAVRTITLR
ncbi:hypothetical protein NRL00_18435 [Aeromonas dhakensis]|nr:hypothetical protein [Aeromonas dhakensis]WAF76393.1 hypothetical protein NRL00_18435 [Aeromonas dhakensis]